MGNSMSRRMRQRLLKRKAKRQLAIEQEVEDYFNKKNESFQWKNEFGIIDKTPCNAQILIQGGVCRDIKY